MAIFLAHYPFYMNMHVCAKFDSDRITGDRPRVYAWNDTDTRTHSRTHARAHAHTLTHTLLYIYRISYSHPKLNPYTDANANYRGRVVIRAWDTLTICEATVCARS